MHKTCYKIFKPVIINIKITKIIINFPTLKVLNNYLYDCFSYYNSSK